MKGCEGGARPEKDSTTVSSFKTPLGGPPSDRVVGENILSGDEHNGIESGRQLQPQKASRIRARGRKTIRRTPKGQFRQVRNPLGKYPFEAVVRQLLKDTDPWYMQSTREERARKFRRIHDIILELRNANKIGTASPKKMTEEDVIQFIGWCKEHLDNATTVKYLGFLNEVLQAVGNASFNVVKLKFRSHIPRRSSKPIRDVASDQVDVLLHGDWALEDAFLDHTAKAALALYLHTGLRSGELRKAKMKDLDVARKEIRVSSPKGEGVWASGTETSPIMPGVEAALTEYVAFRAEHIRERGLEPTEIEPLFPCLDRDGQVRYWTQARWTKLKASVERASGVAFKWKDLRATFAQIAKDRGVMIEAVSKSLRHSSTVTTEMFYARIRSESAFSQMRRVWEAPVAEPKSAD